MTPPDEAREVLKTGLTLDEAQAHCQRDDTHGPGWFDGYTGDGPQQSAVKPNGGR